MKNKLLITTAMVGLISAFSISSVNATIVPAKFRRNVQGTNVGSYDVYGEIYGNSLTLKYGSTIKLSGGKMTYNNATINAEGSSSIVSFGKDTIYANGVSLYDNGKLDVQEKGVLSLIKGYDAKKKEILGTVLVGENGSLTLRGTIKANVEGTNNTGNVIVYGSKAKISGNVNNITNLIMASAIDAKNKKIVTKTSTAKLFDKNYRVNDIYTLKVADLSELTIDSFAFRNSQDTNDIYKNINIINGNIDVYDGATLTVNKDLLVGNPYSLGTERWDGTIYINNGKLVTNKAVLTVAKGIENYNNGLVKTNGTTIYSPYLYGKSSTFNFTNTTFIGDSVVFEEEDSSKKTIATLSGSKLLIKTFSAEGGQYVLSKASTVRADNAIIDDFASLRLMDTSSFGSIKTIKYTVNSSGSYENSYDGLTDNYRVVINNSTLTLDGKSKLENSLYEVQTNKGKETLVLVGENTGKTYHVGEGNVSGVMDTYNTIKGTINIIDSNVTMMGTASIENNMRGDEVDTGNIIIENSTINIYGKNIINASNTISVEDSTINIDKAKTLTANGPVYMTGGALNIAGTLDAALVSDDTTNVNITGVAAKFNKGATGINDLRVNSGINLTLSKLVGKEMGIYAQNFYLDNSKTTFDADLGALNFENIYANNSTLTMKKALLVNGDFNLTNTALTATKDAHIQAANITIGEGIAAKKKITLTDMQLVATDVMNISNASVLLNKGVTLGAVGGINVSGNSLFDIKGNMIIMSNVSFKDTSKLVVAAGKIVNENNGATFNMDNNSAVELNGVLRADVMGVTGNNATLDFKNSKARLCGDIANLQNVNFTKVTAKVADLYQGAIYGVKNLNLINSKITLTNYWAGFEKFNMNASSIYLGTYILQADEVNISDKSSIFLNVNSATEYGKILAPTINLAGNSKAINMTVTLAKGIDLADNTQFKFLDYTTITGNLNKVTISNNRFKFTETAVGQFTAEQTATGKGVIERYSGPITSLASVKSAAEAFVDSEASFTTVKQSELAENLNTLSQVVGGESDYINALRSVNPDDTGAIVRSAVETSNVVLDAASNRTSSGGITSASEGVSSGDTMNGFETWVQLLVNKTKLSRTTNYDGFKGNTTGLALGFEKQLNKTSKAGVGYAYTQSDVKNSIRKVEADTHSLMLYGEYKPNDWFVNAVASYGWSDYDAKTATTKADFDVDTIALKVMTGYDFKFNTTTLTPVAGMRYTYASQDSYTDSNAVRVSSDNNEVLTAIVGAKVKHNHVFNNGFSVRPEARFALTYDVANDGTSSLVSLSNGSSYVVEGRALDRLGWEFGVGVAADVNDNVELSVGYEGKFREDYQDHTGLLNLKYKF